MRLLLACVLVAAAGVTSACGSVSPRTASKPPVTAPARKPQKTPKPAVTAPARKPPKPAVTAPTPPVVTPPTPPPPPQDALLPWPTYGGDNGRTRSVDVPGLRPPFRRLWTFHGHTLLEFPPVAGYGLLYEESFDGRIHAIDPATGADRWSYYSRRCGWSSPALAHGRVFATFIGDLRCSPIHDGGEIVALSARTGRVRWSHTIGKTESSPLVSGGTVYFGDTNGRVSAVDTATGAVQWTYETGSPVKSSPALVDGRLFVDNYAGDVYAFDAGTGTLLWKDSWLGSFYAGPSVAGGRVYVSSKNGSVYALSADSGAELWSFHTGRYVYASPAVWRGVVLVGSYDGNFYAINGATGALRWVFGPGSRARTSSSMAARACHGRCPSAITGSASVIDGVVYFSTLARKTYALDAASGRLIEKWDDGAYSPAVAAGGCLYLVGLGRIYALAPRSSRDPLRSFAPRRNSAGMERRADPYRNLDVIDSRAPRFNQATIGTLSVLAVATGWWWLLAVLAAQLWIGLSVGRRFCLTCLAYFELVQPRFGEGQLEDSRPPRFANLVGAVVLSAAAAAYGAGFATAGAVLGGLVAALALLAAVTGFCTGCEAYKLGCRLRGRPFVSCPLPPRPV